jgi:tRNA modification GTPase
VNKVKKQSISSDIIVSNSRHYDALINALNSLILVEEALSDNIPTDLVAIDIRQALHHLGTITGEITTDEVLGSIFSKFCIGK